MVVRINRMIIRLRTDQVISVFILALFLLLIATAMFLVRLKSAIKTSGDRAMQSVNMVLNLQ